ncbi:FCD domain-containing protein [Devosia sp. ZB163]|uniref:FadR/GntR family transcriptional regulator n=1 Tax=Devosia sp. ZB163 TaxID=3025938 RepID=UPI0023613EDB|nr:FCD domain-containing protein [Devosia sp. ZB163]MDC9824927.1 FCD domain-containing protein [Devosia sp. ZB163]
MSARSNVVRLGEGDTSGRPPVGAVHLSDSAVETLVGQIKSLIDARNLGVGDPLPSERELGETFASSRTTVREAMRILKAYGVVDVRPKVGAVIIDRRMDAVFDLYSFNTLELSRQTYLDTQFFRELIEVGSADRLIENFTTADIVELREINDAMREEAHLPAAARHDFHFHLKLVGLLGNKQVLEIYRIMQPVMLKIMETGVARMKSNGINFDEHGGIVDALESRNRLAYQYRMSQHLEAGLALFKE